MSKRKNQWIIRNTETNKISHFEVKTNVSKKSHSQFKNFIKPGLTILISVLIAFTIVKAWPPGSPYNPGETLNPGCAPGDLNCTVYAPAISTQLINTTLLLLGGGGCQ